MIVVLKGVWENLRILLGTELSPILEKISSFICLKMAHFDAYCL